MKKSIDNLAQIDIVRPRGKGYTTQICKAAKAINGTVLCHNTREAKRLSIEHGVKAKAVTESLRGLHGPFLLDSTACMAIYGDFMKEMTEFEQKIQGDYEIRNRMLLDQRNAFKEDLMKLLKNPVINYKKKQEILRKIEELEEELRMHVELFPPQSDK